MGILLKLVIIGGGQAGLTATLLLQDELEHSEMLLLEKDPYDPKLESLYVISPGSSFEEMVRSLGIDKLEEIAFYDLIQMHDYNGRTIFEYEIPVAIVNMSLLRWALSRLIDGEFIREQTQAIKIQKESEEKAIKILAAGRSSKVFEANSIIDSSGFDWFLTREVMKREGYELFRHNSFLFYQALLESTRIPIDKEALHVVFNEFAVPGGIAFLFSLENDKILISGYYNTYLTSKTPRESANIIKNSFGVVGRIVNIHSRRIILGRPLLLVSPSESVFLLGASNLGIYPTIFSGIVHNNDIVRKLTRTVLNLMDSGIPLEEISAKINDYNAKVIFPFSEILDIIRVILLMMRSATLEDAYVWIPKLLLKTSFLEQIASGEQMIRIATSLLSDSKLLRIVTNLLGVVYELLRISDGIPMSSTQSQAEFIKYFSTEYSQRINKLLPSYLVEKIKF